MVVPSPAVAAIHDGFPFPGYSLYINNNIRRFQFFSLSFNIIRCLILTCAPYPEGFDVQINRPCADRQPPGKRTRATPIRATSGPNTSTGCAHGLTKSYVRVDNW